MSRLRDDLPTSSPSAACDRARFYHPGSEFNRGRYWHKYMIRLRTPYSYTCTCIRIMGRVIPYCTHPTPWPLRSGPCPSELHHSYPGHPQSHETTLCCRPFFNFPPPTLRLFHPVPVQLLNGFLEDFYQKLTQDRRILTLLALHRRTSLAQMYLVPLSFPERSSVTRDAPLRGFSTVLPPPLPP